MKRISQLGALLAFVVMFVMTGCAGDPYLEGARLDFRNQDYDRALENIERALEENPDNADALELKGRILQGKVAQTTDLSERERLIDEMVSSYNRATQAAPQMAPLIEQRLVGAWIDEFQEGIDAFNRADDVDSYVRAADRFRLATRIQPDSAGAYVNQAFALINAERPLDAVRPMERAIELGEDNQEMYIRLASIYQMQDQPDEAVRILRDARDRHPTDQDIQAQLMNAFIAADQLDTAMGEYEALVVREPDNKFYRYNYGSLLLEAGRYNSAIEQLREAVRIDPAYAAAHFNLGAAYINQAVDLTERINEMDDELRGDRANLSRDEIASREDEIDRLVENRRNLFQQAVEPLENALDYSTGVRVEITGDFGLPFEGEITGQAVRDGGSLTRQIQGFTPEDFHIGEGDVSVTVRKRSDEGTLQVNLVVGNDEVASRATDEERGTIEISQNVGPVGFQGQAATAICQALFSAYIQVGDQDAAQEIAQCAGYGDMQ